MEKGHEKIYPGSFIASSFISHPQQEIISFAERKWVVRETPAMKVIAGYPPRYVDSVEKKK